MFFDNKFSGATFLPLLVALVFLGAGFAHAAPVSAGNVGDSFSGSGYLTCPGINDGGITSIGGAAAWVKAEIEIAGTYNISNGYSSVSGPDTGTILIQPENPYSHIVDTTSIRKKSAYSAGTSFQNAYAVGLDTRMDIASETGDYCNDYVNHAGSWKTYSGNITGTGLVAAIGAGGGMTVNTGAQSGVYPGPTWKDSRLSTYSEDGTSAVCYRFGAGTSIEAASSGPTAVAFSYSGVDNLGSSYGEKAWTGKDNTVQKPLYPVGVLKVDGQIVDYVAPTCGRIAYYKDTAYGGAQTRLRAAAPLRGTRTRT